MNLSDEFQAWCDMNGYEAVRATAVSEGYGPARHFIEVDQRHYGIAHVEVVLRDGKWHPLRDEGIRTGYKVLSDERSMRPMAPSEDTPHPVDVVMSFLGLCHTPREALPVGRHPQVVAAEDVEPGDVLSITFSGNVFDEDASLERWGRWASEAARSTQDVSDACGRMGAAMKRTRLAVKRAGHTRRHHARVTDPMFVRLRRYRRGPISKALLAVHPDLRRDLYPRLLAIARESLERHGELFHTDSDLVCLAVKWADLARQWEEEVDAEQDTDPCHGYTDRDLRALGYDRIPF